MSIDDMPMTKAELARRLGVSRTYITYLTQGKKKPSREMADRLARMGLAANLSDNENGNINACSGPLALVAEHLTFNQGVAGSRPARPNQISWERGSTWPNPYIGVGTVNNHPGQFENA